MKNEAAGLHYRPASVYRKRDFFMIIFAWRPNVIVPFQRFRPTFDLNRIQDISTRVVAAELMAETVTECLKEGWNPTTGEFPHIPGKPIPIPETVKYYLPDALKSANISVLEDSTKDRTHISYKSHLKLFIEYLEEKHKYKIAPEQFTRLDAQIYIDHLKGKGYAPKTVNTKFDYAAGLFKWMLGTGIIAHDPFAMINRAKEQETGEEDDQLFTPEELTRIKEHLLATFPELWQYYLFIHYCMMRPDSIMAIQRRDINMKDSRLKISGVNHKNGKTAYKQLLKPHLLYLAPYIAELDRAGCGPETYIFSHKMKPGTEMKAPTRAAELWRQHVKIPLGIYKNAYNGKHTSSTQYIEDNEGNENLLWLQKQMSHASLQTTSIYVSKKKKVKIDESKAKIKQI